MTEDHPAPHHSRARGEPLDGAAVVAVEPPAPQPPGHWEADIVAADLHAAFDQLALGFPGLRTPPSA